MIARNPDCWSWQKTTCSCPPGTLPRPPSVSSCPPAGPAPKSVSSRNTVVTSVGSRFHASRRPRRRRAGHQPIATGPSEPQSARLTYLRVRLCPDGYGMSRLVVLAKAQQVPRFVVLLAHQAARRCRGIGTHTAQADGQKARKQVIWQQFGGLMQQFGRLTSKHGYRVGRSGDPVI